MVNSLLELYGAKDSGHTRPDAGVTMVGESTEPVLFSPENDNSYAGSLGNDGDLFAIVWPYIEKELNTPKTEQELAEKMKVRQGQMQDWLKKALELGKIHKMTRPVRYISTLQLKKSNQPSLFEEVK